MIGGVVAATLLGVLFVPVFFVVILRLFKAQPTEARRPRLVTDVGTSRQGAGLNRECFRSSAEGFRKMLVHP